MHFTWKIILLLLVFTACKNSTDTASIADNTVESPPKASIIPVSILKKAKVHISEINQSDFESISDPNAAFQASEKLCKKSKGYKSDNWEGINDCSWAVEKERIKAFENLVSRKDQELILKMDGGNLNFVNNEQAIKGATYYQFINYLSKPNYYLLKEIITDQCPVSKLINAKTSEQYQIKGNIRPSSDGQYLIAYNHALTSPDCSNKLELYQLNTDGLEKRWHLPLSKNAIVDIKYTDGQESFLCLLANNKTSYHKLTWE